uniref:Protein kinase domain-containing protein n=1 Tax=Panagrellus redivivus TaxID=6233 RepID=A0A7E4ZTF7_PANRE
MAEITCPPNSVLLIPKEVVKYNERLDDVSEGTSVYDDIPGIAQDEDPEMQPQMTDEELQQRLLKYGLDINGLPLRRDLFFENLQKAANFEWSEESASFFAKLRGFDGRNASVPHIVLWDYFGGPSCLDLNVTANEEVAVIAEEFQVREVDNFFEPNRRFFRLPRKWSLVRWITHKTFQPITGLIPSCWLVQKQYFENNRRFYRNATWFIGISDLSTAYECILEDRSSYRPGLFIIFSPLWLNLEPDDYRPYIMLVMCQKTDKIIEIMAKTVLEEKPNNRGIERLLKEVLERKERHNQAKATANPQSNRQEAGADAATAAAVGTSSPAVASGAATGAAAIDNPGTDVDVGGTTTAGDETQAGAASTGPPEPFIAEHAISPYYLKSYTIKRNSIGRYLLFGAQYDTLYDLVTHLANSASPLPHPLDGGPTQPLGLYFDAMPPPCRQPQRDLFALPMQIEQLAAKHFDQVTEPSLLAQAFSFVYRSILDPFKPSHRDFADAAGMDRLSLNEATKYMEKFERPQDANGGKGVGLESADTTIEEVKKRPGTTPMSEVPLDESVMKALPQSILDLRSLQFSEGDLLGSGAFGEVYRGKYTKDNVESDVAIKRLRLIAPDKDTRQAWISEMEVLQLVCHPNIARFYGFCYDDSRENVLLAFELMGIGALSEYLKSREYKTTANEQVDFLIQIARGVGHLHSFDPPIVHGDLAARNVLMTHHPTDQTRFLLKVTDFGLSKTVRHDSHVYPDDPDKIPFKWLPPEVLHRRELNIKSDVWSYGITTTEIYGIADPYGLLGAEKVLPLCNDGHRMERPSSMPHYIYEVVLKCWRFQPQDRPSLEEVEQMLVPLYIEFESAYVESVVARLAELEKEEIENLKV